MKKKLFNLCLIIVLLFVVCACNRTVSYISENGITVTANSSWKEITADKDLEYIYGEVDDTLKESLELVLKGKDAYLTLEKYDIAAELLGHRAYLMWLQEKYQALSAEEMKEWLSGEGMQDRVLSAYEEIGAKSELTDEDIKRIAILTANKSWQLELDAHMVDYELLNEEEIVFLQEKAVLTEYVYAGAEGNLLHFYEANCIKDGYFYTLTIFTNHDQFDKNRETYRAMIEQCKVTE